jgi:hypothetical protein
MDKKEERNKAGKKKFDLLTMTIIKNNVFGNCMRVAF